VLLLLIILLVLLLALHILLLVIFLFLFFFVLLVLIVFFLSLGLDFLLKQICHLSADLCERRVAFLDFISDGRISLAYDCEWKFF